MTFINEIIQNLNTISLATLNEFKSTICDWKGNIIILGNGGSNAISSHIAEDYTKVLKKRAICFSDSARMSCYANDYGYENSFAQYFKEFSDVDSLAILISSSGNSKNILNCADYCLKNKMNYLILTGFEENNSMRQNYKSGAIYDFWVNSKNYGVVECVHEIILHSVI